MRMPMLLSPPSVGSATRNSTDPSSRFRWHSVTTPGRTREEIEAVSTRADSVDVAEVVIAEATAIGMEVIEEVEEVASRVVVASEVEVAAAAVVVAVRNAKETGPVANAAIRTLPGETSATGVRLRRAMAPPEEAVVAVSEEAGVGVVDRSEAVSAIAAAAAVVEVLVAVTVMEDMAVAAAVPCVEATETGISDNGRTKPELADIPHTKRKVNQSPTFISPGRTPIIPEEKTITVT